MNLIIDFPCPMCKKYEQVITYPKSGHLGVVIYKGTLRCSFCQQVIDISTFTRDTQRRPAEEIQIYINSLIKDLYDKDGYRDIEKTISLGLDDEPINWGDFKCYDVGESLVYDDSSKGYTQQFRAYISEVDPSADKLTLYIEDKVKEKFGILIEANTSW